MNLYSSGQLPDNLLKLEMRFLQFWLPKWELAFSRVILGSAPSRRLRQKGERRAIKSMADCVDQCERSRIMARIRSHGNLTTELRFVRIMRKNKISRWRRKYRLHGRPDFVFAHQKLAVFVDGDFWHGNPRRFRMPKSNCAYWKNKILRNRARDRQVNRTLRSMGWQVVRFWESSLSNERAVVSKLNRCLSS
jgi:DNA mismatch endonuclease, patch repair protein